MELYFKNFGIQLTDKQNAAQTITLLIVKKSDYYKSIIDVSSNNKALFRTVKYYLVIFSFFIALNMVAQFPEGFETSVPPTGWVSFIGENGKGIVNNWTSNTYASSGTLAAYIQYENVSPSNQPAQDWLVTPQFTPTSATNILSFAQSQSYPVDYGSIYTVRVSIASQTTHADFTIVDTQTETDFSTIYDIHYVDLSAYNNVSIYVAFVMENDDGDDWYIDDVDLITNNPSVPNCAVNIIPADLAVNIDINSEGVIPISWDAPVTGGPVDSYEIFWGTSSGSLSSLGGVIGTSVFITNINYATTYYWKLVPENYGGSATGCSEMSFTTEGAPPNDDCTGATIVESLPFNTTQDAGGATNNSGSIVSCSPGMNDGVWYSFMPISSGTVDITISNVLGWDPELAIYSGTCGALVCVANIDDGFESEDELLSGISVTNGVQYWINVGYWNNNDEPEGTFDIDISGSIVLNLEDNNIKEVVLYPNPVNDILQFTALDKIENINIYNLLGQEVLRTQPKVLNTQVDMIDLSTGMYIVKVQVGDQLGTYIIVKQ